MATKKFVVILKAVPAGLKPEAAVLTQTPKRSPIAFLARG